MLFYYVRFAGFNPSIKHFRYIWKEDKEDTMTRRLISDFLKEESFNIVYADEKMSVEEAFKVLKDFIDKKGLNFLKNILQKISFGKKEAGLLSNLKGLLDPKVIMALMVIMGSFHAADASSLFNIIKHNTEIIQTEKAKPEISLKQETSVPQFVVNPLDEDIKFPSSFWSSLKNITSNLKDFQLKDTINVEGVKYGIGLEGGAGFSTSELAVKVADKRAMEALSGSSVVKRIVNKDADGNWYCISISKG